jgi:hypothetical protein
MSTGLDSRFRGNEFAIRRYSQRMEFALIGKAGPLRRTDSPRGVSGLRNTQVVSRQPDKDVPVALPVLHSSTKHQIM